MKKFYFALFMSSLLLAGLSTQAQFTVGARGGISIPNLSAAGSEQNPINTGYSSRLGPDFGLFGEYAVSSLFSIEAMVQYSSQGGKKNGFQAFPTPEETAAMFPPGQALSVLYANFNSEAKINYLMIPILAKFTWGFSNSPFHVYIDAGPFVGFLLSANQVTTGTSNVYLDPAAQQPLPGGEQSFNNTQNIKDQLHNANFGVSGNLGVRYQMGKSGIFFEVGGNYGFVNIQKGTQNGKNNTGAATVDLGYSYSLGK